MSASQTLQNQNPVLTLTGVTDPVALKNFQNLQNYFLGQNQLLGFQFKEVIFTSAVTNQPINHSLGYIPQDIIVTKVTGTGSVTFNHGSFTSTNMYVTTTGACRVRFFYGTYWNFQSSVNNVSTDATTYYPVASAVAKPTYQIAQVPLTSSQISTNAYGTSNASQYQMLITDDMVEVNLSNSNSAPSYTVILQGVAAMSGRVVYIRKLGTDTKVVNISTANTKEQFDWGVSTTPLVKPGEFIQLISDGTYWRILNSNKAPTWQFFLTAGNFTYTTPTSRKPIALEFFMVGGGGGGGGCGETTPTAATSGTATTFAGCTAGGGTLGYWSGVGQVGGLGGTYTIPATVIAFGVNGGQGGGANTSQTALTDLSGGQGGSTVWGGSGSSGWANPGGIGQPNTGGGGGGGGSTGATTQTYTGSGGGSGAYVNGLLEAPLAATYPVTIGQGGTGGGNTTGGAAGGAGARGGLYVKEIYQ